MPGEQPLAAQNEGEAIGDPGIVLQPHALGKIKIQIGHVTADFPPRSRRFQEAQPEIWPAEVRERHVDQQDSRHGVALA